MYCMWLLPNVIVDDFTNYLARSQVGELDHKEGWAPKNWCFQTVVLKKILESPLDCKEIKPVNHWKGWCSSWSSNTLATWCEEPTLWKRPWCWERLRAKGDRDDRGWDGWMASSTQRIWVWANSGRQWRTGKPGELPSMGLQRGGHDRATEQQHGEQSPRIKTATNSL